MTALNTEKTVRLSVEVPKEIKHSLQALANAEERSVHFLMKRAINEYLEREQQKKVAREAFLEEGEEAIIAYRQTGKHITHDEVSEWLLSHKSDRTPRPAPTCHE